MPYTPIPTPQVISDLVALLAAQDEQIRSMERSAGAYAGSVKPVGLLRVRTDSSLLGSSLEVIERWDGTTWKAFAVATSSQICDTGEVPMAADLDLDGHKVVGLAAGAASGDAVEFDQLAAALGAAWGADRDAGGYLLLNAGDPATQASMNAMARIVDTFQNPHGLFWKSDALMFDDGTGGGSPVNLNVTNGGRRSAANAATSFCPRVVYIRLSGAITLVGGGSIGTLSAKVYTATRFGDESGWQTVASETIGGITFNVDVQWKTDLTGSGRGFYLRLKRTTNSDQYTPADARASAIGGVSADGAP
jgi:hypothetical protein